jgi:hypothetical protein
MIALLALFLSSACAQPNIMTTVLPEDPNITTFSAGYHEIYVGSLDWEGYSSVTISSDDFEATGESTIPIDRPYVSFGIWGDSGGTKEYSLTFSGGGPGFTVNESFYVDPEPPDEGGPVVLSDFDFGQEYDSAQEVRFDCFGSLIYPADCEPAGEHRIGSGQWEEFEFSSPVEFSFDGTKEIQIRAENEIGLSSTTIFTLSIDLPDPETPPANNTSDSHSGSTYTTHFPAEDENPEDDAQNTLQETDLNAGPEPDLSEESAAPQNEENSTDFKEDTGNSISTAIADEGVSEKTVGTAPATLAMGILDMTGFFSLTIPEVSAPEIDATGMAALWLPDQGLTWVPLVLILAILVLLLFTGKKRGKK